MAEQLDICLLGEFSLTKGGQSLKSLNADRPQSLLAFLLLHRRGPVSRQQLAYTFWPDSSDEQARTNLRNLLHTLRRGLPEADSYLALDTHTVQWRSGGSYTLDVAGFQDALAATKVVASDDQRQESLETAVSLYKGPLLPGNYDDWLIPLREELQQAYQDALRQLAHLLAKHGDFDTAVHYARLYQKQDPLAETAVILLMQLYAQLGDQTAVRRVYQTCVAALRQELDAEPGLETERALLAALKQAEQAGEQQGTEGETAVSLPKRATPRQAKKLPPQPTPFVGREAELAKLAEQLANPACRLVTIVGPGGTGKTRLALQSAYGHVTVFADGAVFVSLTAVTDPTVLPGTIAQALGVRFNATASRKTQLLQYMADKEMLIVLDHLEQLGDKVTLLADLLMAAPGVKLLITSRQRLQLQEEWVFALQGLPLPDADNLADVPENSAARLFVQSAKRHQADFVPEMADWQAIVRICQLVDGMPLGLELAAPWIRLLSCAEIEAEIRKNLDFLTSTQHNIPERHRSMRAVFNQSWQMLTPLEQVVFSRLSLFVSGFGREGAEVVAGATLPVLSDLLDKSLIRRLDNGRYDIHELLRQYAAAQLASTQEEACTARAQFAAFYVTLAETAVIHLVGPEQQQWLEKLDLEYDNVRAVLSWAVETGAEETAVRLGAALGRYWWLRYRAQEGGMWLRQILAMSTPEMEGHSRALSYAGMLARLRRDYVEAETRLSQSIQQQRLSGNKDDLGRSLNELGMSYLDQGLYAQAQPYFAEWLMLAHELNFAHGISIALLNLGMATYYQGMLNQAEGYFQESLALSRELGLETNVAMLLNSYSMLKLDLNEAEAAREMLLESLTLNAKLGHTDGLSWAFLGLLTFHYQTEHWETAAFFAGVHEHCRQTLGAPLPPTNQRHFDQICTDLQIRLGAEAFSLHQQKGRTMPLADAVALAGKMGGVNNEL